MMLGAEAKSWPEKLATRLRVTCSMLWAMSPFVAKWTNSSSPPAAFMHEMRSRLESGIVRKSKARWPAISSGRTSGSACRSSAAFSSLSALPVRPRAANDSR